MDSNDILEFIAESQKTLEGVWDELGVAGDEREQLLRGLATDARAVFASGVQGQQQRLDKNKEELTEIHTKTESMASTLLVEAKIPDRRGDEALMPYIGRCQARLDDLKAVHDDRMKTLIDVMGKTHEAFELIGMEIEDSFAEIGEKVTTMRIREFRTRLSELEAEAAQRHSHVEEVRQECEQLWAAMASGPAEDDDFEQCVGDSADAVGLSQESMDKIRELRDSLQKEKARREAHIAKVGGDITELWEKLDTPEEEQQAFLSSHDGVGDDVISYCESYLADRKAEFHGRLRELIAAARGRITDLWDELMFGEEQRAEFSQFFVDIGPGSADAAAEEEDAKASGDEAEEEEEEVAPAASSTSDLVTEELFEAHRAEEQSLAEKAARLRPILRLVGKRVQLLADKEEYAKMLADPSRLLSRRRGTERLREEKLERRVRKELPAVVAKLRAEVPKWEENEGELIIDGERFLDSLDAFEQEEKAQREAKKAAREQRRATGGPAPAAGSASSVAAGTTARRTARTAANRSRTRSRDTAPKRATAATAKAKAGAKAGSTAAKRRGAGVLEASGRRNSRIPRPTAHASKPKAAHAPPARGRSSRASSRSSRGSSVAEEEEERAPTPQPDQEESVVVAAEAAEGAERMLEAIEG